jgi:hypothetical protein
MSTLETRRINPATATTVTLGAAGETVAISASQLKTNTIKDAGGNTILTSDGSGTLSSVNSALGAGMTLISSQTASSSASISFTTGIDSTYDEYAFYCVNMHPASDGVVFEWQVSSDGGSSYGMTITSTAYRAYHYENNAGAAVAYVAGDDLAQQTEYQHTIEQVGNDADQSVSGMLQLFSPSSTASVKTWLSHFNGCHSGNVTIDEYTSGYVNSTSAVNAINFRMAAGNVDAGTIYMYGMK